VLLGSCNKPKLIEIDSEKLLETVKILSNDSYEGRAFSKLGNKKAQTLILERFNEVGLQPVLNNNLFQEFSHTFKGKDRQDVFPIEKANQDFSNVPDTTAYGANIVGILKGQSEKSIVITAHYDHLGL
jgi:hypothetical protein